MSGKLIRICLCTIPAVLIIIIAGYLVYRYIADESVEQAHYDRDETELVVVNTSGATLTLFIAGKHLDEARELREFNGERIWLSRGNYFLRADQNGTIVFYPVPIQGYSSGTEKDGTFSVTVRPVQQQPFANSDLDLVFIPSGHFLFGDRLNPNEPHLVWTPGFFIARFEVSNDDFRKFINDPNGYSDEANWSEDGKRWRSRSGGASSAKLLPADREYGRFGQGDQPVTQVNWFEAAAYCKWLTRQRGEGRWLFSLPTESEWEKAARGPDNFDYPLAQNLSDAELALYNWKKNPLAPVTVIGSAETPAKYRPNRYGLYHLGGNVVEWTQGTYKPFNREKPYVDDERNSDGLSGVRVVRGGSWYSASNALLYIPYRDTFQPEVSHNDLGFRIVARSLMN